jgi:hypothetical protein
MQAAWKIRACGAAIIISLAALAYQPAMHGQFVWDDDSWTTQIPQLMQGLSGLEKMWFQITALQQYYPLTGTSFWIDHQLWGLNTFPYHVENLLLHITSALLFWHLLKKLEVPGAWLAGAIFAVHPVMVESVAWITERKNTLSMVLFLCSLLTYGHFTHFWKDNDKTRRNGWVWGLAILLFVLALTAKATAFCLPAVLLLLCWWKKGKIDWKRDVLPTLPLFAISIGYCRITSSLETNHIGASGPEWDISFPARCLIAGRVIWFYTAKLLWPSQLCFVYPRWHLNVWSWRQWMLPASVVGIVVALWHYRTRIGRGPLTAVLFFIGTLFPALGFMNAYFMRFSFVCDHWMYLSTLGMIALAAALIARIQSQAVVYACAAILLGICATLTWRQCHIYSDKETLWRDTLAKNPDAWLAQYNLGYLLQTDGNIAGAKQLYERTLQINPNCDEAQNNLAWLLATLAPADGRDPARAVTLAQKSCESTDNRDPNRLDTLAVAYAADGRFDDAVATTQLAIVLAEQTGQMELIRHMQARLMLYREGHAYNPSDTLGS